MATHSCSFAWKIPWTESLVGYSPWGRKELDKTERLSLPFPSPTLIQKKQEFQKNIYFCSIDYAKVFDCMDYNKPQKILKEMEIPDHLTCLLRNLYSGQEATVRTRHGTADWFQIEKGVCQGCISSPCLYITYTQNTSHEMPGWMKHKLESGLLGEISITSDMQMTPPLWQKAKRN